MALTKKPKRVVRSKKNPAVLAITPTGKRKYNWPFLRGLYVEGVEEDGARKWLRLDDIATRYGVQVVRLKERSSYEHWVEQRDAFRMDWEQRRRADRLKMMAREGIIFDENSLKVAKMGMTAVQTRLAEIIRDIQAQAAVRKRALEAMAAGGPVNAADLETVIDARELNTLAMAAQGWQTVGQKALGEDVIKHEISGPGGGPMENVLRVIPELTRDNPERLADFLHAAGRAGVIPELENILEGEVLSEGNGEEAEEA